MFFEREVQIYIYIITLLIINIILIFRKLTIVIYKYNTQDVYFI